LAQICRETGDERGWGKTVRRLGSKRADKWNSRDEAKKGRTTSVRDGEGGAARLLPRTSPLISAPSPTIAWAGNILQRGGSTEPAAAFVFSFRETARF